MSVWRTCRGIMQLGPDAAAARFGTKARLLSCYFPSRPAQTSMASVFRTGVRAARAVPAVAVSGVLVSAAMGAVCAEVSNA